MAKAKLERDEARSAVGAHTIQWEQDVHRAVTATEVGRLVRL